MVVFLAHPNKFVVLSIFSLSWFYIRLMHKKLGRQCHSAVA